LIGGFFVDRLDAQRLDERIAIKPTADGDNATTAKQDYNNNADDETRIALLGGFRTARHFIHDFFSL